MNTAIVVITIVAFVSGIALVVWSAINTRNRYSVDFMKRKSEREKLRLSRRL